jgi:hypothetical protein
MKIHLRNSLVHPLGSFFFKLQAYTQTTEIVCATCKNSTLPAVFNPYYTEINRSTNIARRMKANVLKVSLETLQYSTCYYASNFTNIPPPKKNFRFINVLLKAIFYSIILNFRKPCLNQTVNYIYLKIYYYEKRLH